MGRKPNPTSLYCARNYRTEAEAEAKHSECYVEHNCRVKRYRLRNASKVNAKRRANSARAKEIETIEPVLPEAYRAELEIYGKQYLRQKKTRERTPCQEVFSRSSNSHFGKNRDLVLLQR